jgi:hypothetical protein
MKTINFSLENNEEEVSPDREADSIEDLQAQLYDLTLCHVSRGEIEYALSNGTPIELKDADNTIIYMSH